MPAYRSTFFTARWNLQNRFYFLGEFEIQQEIQV